MPQRTAVGVVGVAVAVLAVAACGRLSFDGRTDAPPAPALDGPTADAPVAVGCQMPATVHDTFDVGPPCKAWGVTDTDNTMLSIASGQLVVNPAPNIQSTRGGCFQPATIPFDPDVGIFAQVTTLGDADEYMEIIADNQVGTSWTLVWGAHSLFTRSATSTGDGTTLGMVPVPFDAATSSWLRMRPSADGAAVVGEYSADGETWYEFGRDPTVPSAMVEAKLYGGTFRSDPAPAPLVFDSFNACP